MSTNNKKTECSEVRQNSSEEEVSELRSKGRVEGNEWKARGTVSQTLGIIHAKGLPIRALPTREGDSSENPKPAKCD